MRRITAKLLMNAIVIVPLLMLLAETRFLQSLIVSIVFSVIAYGVGDQVILGVSNNAVATMSDAVLAFIYFWLVSVWLGWPWTVGGLLTLTIAIGAIEYAYHLLLEKIDEGERHRQGGA